LIFKTADDLLRHIRLGMPLPVYFIYGSDSARKRRFADAVANLAMGGKAGPGLHVFNGNVSADALADAAFEISFDGGRRCVLAEDLPLEKLNSTERGKLEQFVTELCAENGATAVFLYNVIDAEPKKDKKKLEKYASFRRLIDKKGGGVVLCEPYTTAELCRLAESEAEAHGASMDRKVSYALVSRCGTDSAVVRGETKKAAEYAKDGKVTEEILEKVTCEAPDARIYDLADRVKGGDFASAFAVIDELCAMGEEPSSILANLSGAYVDLFRARCAAACGKTKSDMARDWPQSYAGREFIAERAIRNRSLYSAAVLSGMLDILLTADRKIKSTGTDPRMVLEEAVGRLFLAGRGS